MRVNIAFLFRATYYQHATQAFPSMKTDVTFHSKADESKNHHPPSFLLPSLGRELLPWRKILAILSLLPRGHAFSLPRSSSVMSSTNVFLSSLAAVEAGSPILYDSTPCFSSRLLRRESIFSSRFRPTLFESERR